MADKLIAQAEKFRANISAPKGTDELKLGANETDNDNDDDFFHISCHIEAGLQEKIECREFVGHEKLLPKERYMTPGDERKLELVTHEGQAFFTPMQDKSAKITGLRKWEQAFRIYAAIYSKAQPHRASEIWQYIYTINLAASSYHWENVAFYDNTFRHLMFMKPKRSWAKTYTQGWNLAMTEPLSNRGEHNANFVQKKGVSAGQSGGGKSWKDCCCWKYNKNRCEKTAADCNWDHRCRYCGGWNHSFVNCQKRARKSGDGAGGSGGNNKQ